MREKLIGKINDQVGMNPKNRTLPIVGLEDFFVGNDDEGSIGCNLLNHPGIETFYNILRTIREKDCVQDVLVEIYDVEDDYWPFSERLYILTNSTIEEVAEWVSVLEPDEIGEGYAFGQPKIAPSLRAGYRVISLWWD